MNIDIVRCYYKTILQTPNLPYGKEFYRNWIITYPENQLSKGFVTKEERLSDELTIISTVEVIG